MFHKVMLTATMLKTNITQRIKTTNLSKQVKVAGATSGAFGTKATDSTISLGRADAFNLGVLYLTQRIQVQMRFITLTLSNVNGTFIRGEKITGGTSGWY